MKKNTPSFPESAATLGALLRAPYRRLQQLLYAELAQKFPEVRRAHSVVFRHIAPGGSRLTDLADQAEMSKQSMAYLVGYLTTHGYVRADDHPDDRRALRVNLTAKGLRFVEAALAASVRLEHQAEDRLGTARLRELRGLLKELGDAFAKAE